MVVHYEFILHSTVYSCQTGQFLTEIQTTVALHHDPNPNANPTPNIK